MSLSSGLGGAWTLLCSHYWFYHQIRLDAPRSSPGKPKFNHLHTNPKPRHFVHVFFPATSFVLVLARFQGLDTVDWKRYVPRRWGLLIS